MIRISGEEIVGDDDVSEERLSGNLRIVVEIQCHIVEYKKCSYVLGNHSMVTCDGSYSKRC